ncbi:uncharacterized protein LOC129218210 [Uloborus diversus]|uniref:uncharacterized protein LOC129218210 n=1 Tax=Uloborus diversus TaxID=327109 RepID=UPI0024097603|nr:uncharacterized protein LOC129218210 [Uloborus diversus]
MLMNLISKGNIFGSVQCFMYTIEWQKRGLPHAHILVWLREKIHAQRVDEFISSEFPNPQEDPGLFNCIRTQMVHGPCGVINLNSPCMKNGKCSKRYPRKLVKETQTGVDGYPLYRRRSPEDGGFTTQLAVKGKDVLIDNKWIVPYCPLLSKIFNGHINVEFCNSIKYVCKYVNKGSDMAVFHVNSTSNQQNEVREYQVGRYISSNEAAWRILNFPIHERHPTVIHLSVHLENGQRVYFTAANAAEWAQMTQETTLTSFFRLCQEDDFASTLLYNEVPKYFTWNNSSKKWSRRKVGHEVPNHPGLKCSDALGRVFSIHPNNSECFHLRLLLHEVRGPVSFIALETVERYVCATFKEACQLKGLLEDDNHWNATLEEAALTRSPVMLRNLFVVILQTCDLSNPLHLWLNFREHLSEDILHQRRISSNNMEIQFDDSIFNNALIIVEDKMKSSGGLGLQPVGLPSADRSRETSDHVEKVYNTELLRILLQENKPKLIPNQKEAYTVFRWHKDFRSSRESTDDMERVGHPVTTTTEESVAKVKYLLERDHRLSLRIISEELNRNHMSL